MGVGPHCSHVEPDVLAKSLDDVSQVHAEDVSCVTIGQYCARSPHALRHNAQMTSMLELVFHAYNVLLVLGIGFIELSEYLRFFASSDIPDSQLAQPDRNG